MTETIELKLSREVAISDLPRTYRECNDISEMTDMHLAKAWMLCGTHAGTWDWDTVIVGGDNATQ